MFACDVERSCIEIVTLSVLAQNYLRFKRSPDVSFFLKSDENRISLKTNPSHVGMGDSCADLILLSSFARLPPMMIVIER